MPKITHKKQGRPRRSELGRALPRRSPQAKAGRPKQQAVQVAVKKSVTGFGLFADEDIKRGQFVIEYIGTIIPDAVAAKQTTKYLFEINSKWTIDGKTRNNIARYINHACKPNCQIEIYGHRVKIYAGKHIKKGEEITYDYDTEYWEHYIKPYGCKCGTCRKK